MLTFRRLKRCNIDGQEIHIKSVRNTGASITVDVEVTTKLGEVGSAHLMLYTSKGSMRITKKRGEDAQIVRTLSEEIIRSLLNKFMTGELTEAKVKELERKKSLNKTVKKPVARDSSCTCNVCGQTFLSGHGVKIHMNIHKPKKRNVEHRFKLNVLPNQPTKQYECTQCGKVMSSMQDLKEHEIAHHKIFPATPKPLEKKSVVILKNEAGDVQNDQSSQNCKCDKCGLIVTTKKNLSDHMKDHIESNSPSHKRTKIDVEEEALEKIKDLSVVETEKGMEDMDIDVEKKRKRENSYKKDKEVKVDKPKSEKKVDPNL